MRGQDMQWQSCVLTGYSSSHDGPIVAILDHLFCPARIFCFCLAVSIIDQACSFKMADYYRADIKSQGPGISPGYLYDGKWKRNITKINPLLFDSPPVVSGLKGLNVR